MPKPKPSTTSTEPAPPMVPSQAVQLSALLAVMFTAVLVFILLSR